MPPRKMCSSVAAAGHPSSSSSSPSVLREEPSAPATSGTTSGNVTDCPADCRAQRSKSEPGLQSVCLFPVKECHQATSAIRRDSDNPRHYSSLLSTESEITVETSASFSASELDSSSSSIATSSILSSSNHSTSRSTKKSQRRRSSVQFGSLTIRSYEVQLGDNPSCSTGAPVSIGWKYNELNPICIDAYEDWMKDKRRSKSEFHLPRSERESILRHYGYSRTQLTEATKELAKIKKQRRASLKTTPITRIHESVIDMNLKMKMRRRCSC